MGHGIAVRRLLLIDLLHPDGTIYDCKIEFSSRSGKRHQKNSRHFDCLGAPKQKAVSQRLEELEATRVKDPEFEAEWLDQFGYQPGWNPKALSESYGWRDHFNIHYFERLQSLLAACRP